jgi:hypothetical protein
MHLNAFADAGFLFALISKAGAIFRLIVVRSSKQRGDKVGRGIVGGTEFNGGGGGKIGFGCESSHAVLVRPSDIGRLKKLWGVRKWRSCSNEKCSKKASPTAQICVNT